MQIAVYHVDAFADVPFSGNPAAVCILPNWLPDRVLQSIASEFHLPVTVFLFRDQGRFQIRWFTPEYEINLCGHGTLAAAYIIMTKLEPTWSKVEMFHPITGVLEAKKQNEWFSLRLPAKDLQTVSNTTLLESGFGLPPQEIFQHKDEQILAVFKSEEEIKNIQPRIYELQKTIHRAIIVTAPGSEFDFVSRVFYPKKKMFEDYVTGSSFCLLVPYWAMRLNKNRLHACQISERRGQVLTELHENQIELQGKAYCFMSGEIVKIPDSLGVK